MFAKGLQPLTYVTQLIDTSNTMTPYDYNRVTTTYVTPRPTVLVDAKTVKKSKNTLASKLGKSSYGPQKSRK